MAAECLGPPRSVAEAHGSRTRELAAPGRPGTSMELDLSEFGAAEVAAAVALVAGLPDGGISLDDVAAVRVLGRFPGAGPEALQGLDGATCALRLRDACAAACGDDPAVLRSCVAVLEFLGAPVMATALAAAALSKAAGGMTFRGECEAVGA